MTKPEYAFVHIPKNAGTSFRFALQKSVKIQYHPHQVSKDNIDKLKRIFVVRDPVDRFTSAFFYVSRLQPTSMMHVFSTPEDLLSAYKEFDSRVGVFMKPHKITHTIYGKPIETDWVFSKQSDWIYDPCYLLNFSTLRQDMYTLGKRIGVNVILPYLNQSVKLPFTYSQDSLDLLGLIYKDDFALYKTIPKIT